MQETTRPPAGYGPVPTLVRCEPGGHDVPARDAQEIGSPDSVLTGPGRGPRYACRAHVLSEGLVPLATYVGRRDGAPTPARRPA